MGLNLSQHFSVDKTKAVEGVRVEIGQGAYLIIAKMKNAKMVAFLQHTLKPYAKQLKMGTIDPLILEEATYKSVAKHVLKGWGGIIDSSGAEIPFSEEAALQILRELPEFAETVEGYATDSNLFREEEIAEAVGNS